MKRCSGLIAAVLFGAATSLPIQQCAGQGDVTALFTAPVTIQITGLNLTHDYDTGESLATLYVQFIGDELFVAELVPPCGQMGWYVFDPTTPTGKLFYSTIITAKATDSDIVVSGTGDCALNGSVHDAQALHYVGLR